MNAILEQILESPQLPEIVDMLQSRLEEERVRRRKFYDDLTEDQKAEFINGQVIVHSLAKARHLKAKDNLQRLLQVHVEVNELGFVAGEKTLCVFPRNDYEPDVCFFGPEKTGHITPNTLKFPIPDFIAEVLSESTELKDRGDKFQDYQSHGVGEYWIIDPDKEMLEQYILRGAVYDLAQKSGTGEVRSVAVPGFCIPVRALFDAALNLNVMRQLLGAAGR